MSPQEENEAVRLLKEVLERISKIEHRQHQLHMRLVPFENAARLGRKAMWVGISAFIGGAGLAAWSFFSTKVFGKP